MFSKPKAELAHGLGGCGFVLRLECGIGAEIGRQQFTYGTYTLLLAIFLCAWQ